MSLTLPEIEIEPSVVTKPSTGEVIVTCGGVVSSVTSTLLVPTAPEAAVAVAVMTFGPSASGSAMLKLLPATGAAIELIVTVAVGSSTVPVTVVGVMLKKERLAGDVIVTFGIRT